MKIPKEIKIKTAMLPDDVLAWMGVQMERYHKKGSTFVIDTLITYYDDIVATNIQKVEIVNTNGELSQGDTSSTPPPSACDTSGISQTLQNQEGKNIPTTTNNFF